MTPKPRAYPATLDFALLRGALEEIPFGVATMRAETVIYANDALMKIYGVAPGGLEGKHLSQLFDAETFGHIAQCLDETRRFDGRVPARSFDGRELTVEAHVERYKSGAVGVGGFLIVRDVSVELSALGRLVDQLGGAIFRISVADGAVEFISPTITKLTGLSVTECLEHPVLLTTLVSSEERDRLAFLYRRVANGEITVASAHVSLCRHDGVTRVLHVRATPRLDASGQVCEIDGVVTDATREAEQVRGVPSSLPAQPGKSGDIAAPLAPGMVDVIHELLRETSQHLHQLRREIRAMRAAVQARTSTMPEPLSTLLSERLDALSVPVASAMAVNRAVRRSLGGRTLGAPFGEVLNNVGTTLGQVLGPSTLTVDPGDAAGTIICERVDELTLALTYLALRAYRFAGAGTLALEARLAPSTAMDTRPRSWIGSPPREPEQIILEIAAFAPEEVSDLVTEISSDMLKTIPHASDADIAFAGATALVGCAGGSIDADEATVSTARTAIRIRTSP